MLKAHTILLVWSIRCQIKKKINEALLIVFSEMHSNEIIIWSIDSIQAKHFIQALGIWPGAGQVLRPWISIPARVIITQFIMNFPKFLVSGRFPVGFYRRCPNPRRLRHFINQSRPRAVIGLSQSALIADRSLVGINCAWWTVSGWPLTPTRLATTRSTTRCRLSNHRGATVAGNKP